MGRQRSRSYAQHCRPGADGANPSLVGRDERSRPPHPDGRSGLAIRSLWRRLRRLGGAFACHHQSHAWCARDRGRRRCTRPRHAGHRHGARRAGPDPVDWIYQSWAYDAHNVETTPGHGGDTAAALRTIRAPTLLLVPALDLYNPVDDAVEAAELIPNATLVRLDGCAGHAVGADSSPQLADVRGAISEFLIKLAS